MKIPFVKDRYFNKRYLGSKLYLRNLEGYVYFAAIELGDDPYNFLAVFDSSTCSKTNGHEGIRENSKGIVITIDNSWSWNDWMFEKINKQLELF